MSNNTIKAIMRIKAGNATKQAKRDAALLAEERAKCKLLRPLRRIVEEAADCWVGTAPPKRVREYSRFSEYSSCITVLSMVLNVESLKDRTIGIRIPGELRSHVCDVQSAKQLLLEHIAKYVQFPPSQSDIPPQYAQPDI